MNNIIEMAKEVGFTVINEKICASNIEYGIDITYRLNTLANLVETATLESLTLEQIKELYVQKGRDLGELIGEQEADDKENEVTLDKRDLFDFVRGAIKDALYFTYEEQREADLWAEAHYRTDECLSKLYTKPISPVPDDVAKDAARYKILREYWIDCDELGIYGTHNVIDYRVDEKLASNRKDEL